MSNSNNSIEIVITVLQHLQLPITLVPSIEFKLSSINIQQCSFTVTLPQSTHLFACLVVNATSVWLETDTSAVPQNLDPQSKRMLFAYISWWDTCLLVVSGWWTYWGACSQSWLVFIPQRMLRRPDTLRTAPLVAPGQYMWVTSRSGCLLWAFVGDPLPLDGAASFSAPNCGATGIERTYVSWKGLVESQVQGGEKRGSWFPRVCLWEGCHEMNDSEMLQYKLCLSLHGT